MSKAAYWILGGAALCVAGAVLLDLNIQHIGWTLIALGVSAIIAGPQAANL